MDFLQLMTEARTCRRYEGAREFPSDVLSGLVDCARIMPCTGNSQTLRYITVQGGEKRKGVFDALAWAAQLKNWKPEENERPAGYIIILAPRGDDGKVSPNIHIDTGIAGQSIQLAAWTRGVGACMFRSFNPRKLADVVAVPPGYEVMLVIALGYPVEERRIAPVGADGSLRYYRDEAGVHYVPKLSLKDVLVGAY
jgi:nitroreductase